MKKKVLFCIRDFNHGGIPKSLQNLLSLIDKDKYDITIFCAWQQGYYKQVFEKYSVIPQDKLMFLFCVNYKSLSGFTLVKALLIKILAKIWLKLNVDIFDAYLRRIARKTAAAGNYDDAVAFAEGWITNLVSYMDAIPRKIAWIHMDYKRVLAYDKGKNNNLLYSKFDYIVSPCKFSAKSFIDIHPDFAPKVRSIKNLLDVDAIKNSAIANINDINKDNNIFSIISVGRICYEKQFYEIPRIASEVKKQFHNFKWYIVGAGSDVEVNVLKDNIKKYVVDDCVILLGEKNNPYPYIASCNLLALLSISETFSYVAYEAKILGVPVITTDFGAAYEIVENNTSVVVSKDCFASELIRLMCDSAYYNQLLQGVKNYRYDNVGILCEIETLFDQYDA
ncbi:MAG: glycosyltransferase [Candidatus Aphodosoma sp.]